MPDQLANKQGPTGRGQQVSPRPGVISLLELYSIEEAKARLGWSDSALRSAKRRGLRVMACGKRRYVTGREIIRFLGTHAVKPNGTGTSA